ncbi:MAG: type II toxin-antitoxin system HicA family toxin [Candidatus Niyogibacteria bacterium]|nr:MAG: type II toxin-antitoxin system HicA family toxin [Candidatus Niyogibacteria bacterium]
MPKPVDLRIIIRVLKVKGFFFVSQKGAHAKFRKLDSPAKTVIVKMAKKQIPYGTFRSILLQSGLKESDFRNK